MSSEAVVKCTGLGREYLRGRVTVRALNGVDLSVTRGEVVGIIGPSGSGKTTLLNLIGGLDRPTTGRVLVDNVDLSQLSDDQLSDYRLKKIGFIFQFYNLVSTLTARENVELPMGFARAPKIDQDTRARALLKTVGLEARVDHTPDELSGGEQQRVAVARALANNPALVLADEPTGDLDSQSAKSLMDLIMALRGERQVTFLLVTHDPIVVARCDRAYSVRDGRIIREISKADSEKLVSSERAMLEGLY
jgi:putative ABC transport system ATP-binding protein